MNSPSPYIPVCSCNYFEGRSEELVENWMQEVAKQTSVAKDCKGLAANEHYLTLQKQGGSKHSKKDDPSFCVTMQGRMQQELWLICRIAGQGSVLQPPCSPDLSPCDYDLIPKTKEPLRGSRFCTVHDVLQATDCSIRNILRLGCVNDIQRLPHRCERVIHNGGGYIEIL